MDLSNKMCLKDRTNFIILDVPKAHNINNNK